MTNPKASLLIVTYNHESLVEDALRGAVEQDYENLEIVVSDDCSSDSTYEKVQQFLGGYSGPHRIVINRNEQNLGICGNINRAVALSSGELIIPAAGDDISLRNRVKDVVRCWLEHDLTPDLIASDLIDMSESGELGNVIQQEDMQRYTSLDAWARKPPRLIGAGLSWTRRLYDRFSGFPEGATSEDLILGFRSIACGGVVNLRKPLVCYRRGGISSSRKAISVEDVTAGLTRKVKSSIVELRTLELDSKALNADKNVVQQIVRRRRREEYIDAMLCNKENRVFNLFFFSGVDFPFRVRVGSYALCSFVPALFFALKRIFRK